MGNTCCQENTNEGIIFEVEALTKIQVSDVPKSSDYYEAQWPENDHFLKEKLSGSQIGNKREQQRPKKHKIYDRWYCGDWKHGEPYGKGILYIKGDHKSTYYEGDFDGQPNGKGKVIFNEGQAVYEGQIKNAKAEGQGYFRSYKQGSTFTGTWKDSNPYNGELLLERVVDIDDRQQILVSTILIDEEKDQNVIKYPDGRIYTGKIDKNRFVPHGRGRVQFANGSAYEGDWQLGEMHGKGKFSWPDKSSYEGDYLFGRKHGQGRFIFSSGNYYEGYWVDGKQSGRGILYSSKSDQLKNGVWKNGSFIGPDHLIRDYE